MSRRDDELYELMRRIEKMVIAVANPHTETDERTEYLQTLYEFEGTDEAWEISFAFLSLEFTEESAPLWQFGATTLEHKVQFDLARLGGSKRRELLDSLWEALQKTCDVYWEVKQMAAASARGFAGSSERARAKRLSRGAYSTMVNLTSALTVLSWLWLDWESAVVDILGWVEGDGSGEMGLRRGGLEALLLHVTQLGSLLCSCPPWDVETRAIHARDVRREQLRLSSGRMMEVFGGVLRSCASEAVAGEDGVMRLPEESERRAENVLGALQMWVDAQLLDEEHFLEQGIVDGAMQLIRGGLVAEHVGVAREGSEFVAALSAWCAQHVKEAERLWSELWLGVVGLVDVQDDIPERHQACMALRYLGNMVEVVARQMLVRGAKVEDEMVDAILRIAGGRRWEAAWFVCPSWLVLERTSSAAKALEMGCTAVLQSVMLTDEILDDSMVDDELANEFLVSWRTTGLMYLVNSAARVHGIQTLADVYLDRLGESSTWQEAEAAITALAMVVTVALEPRASGEGQEEDVRALDRTLSERLVPELERCHSHGLTRAAVCMLANKLCGSSSLESFSPPLLDALADFVVGGTLVPFLTLGGPDAVRAAEEVRATKCELEAAIIAASSMLSHLHGSLVGSKVDELLSVIHTLRPQDFSTLAPALVRAATNASQVSDSGTESKPADAVCYELLAPAVEELEMLANAKHVILEDAVEAFTVRAEQIEGVMLGVSRSTSAAAVEIVQEAFLRMWPALEKCHSSDIAVRSFGSVASIAHRQTPGAVTSDFAVAFASECVDRFRSSDVSAYLFVATVIFRTRCHSMRPGVEADALSRMIDDLATHGFTILAGDDVTPFREHPDVTSDLFYFLSEIVLNTPEYLLSWPLLDASIQCAAAALEVEHSEANSNALFYIKSVLRIAVPRPDTEFDHELVSNAKAVILPIIYDHGPHIVHLALQGAAGGIAAERISDSRGSITTLLITLQQMDRATLTTWVHEKLELYLDQPDIAEFSKRIAETSEPDDMDALLFAFRRIVADRRYRNRQLAP